jgi:hypothetical protein
MSYPEVKKKSVAGKFAVRSETYCWTQKLNREDYDIDKYSALPHTKRSSAR